MKIKAPKNYLDLHNLAERLGVSYQWLWRAIQRGDLKAKRLSKRGFWLVHEDEAKRMEAELK
jgi:predicted site-specific integrase-resolvase